MRIRVSPTGGIPGPIRCLIGFLLLTATASAQPAALRLFPNLESNIDRPLRYRPDGADFVIGNGTEFFNRPLYGGNTAFRVDGGDKPEFVLYLPGRGGNLRLGIRRLGREDAGAPPAAKWLHDADQITTRYRPGELLYEIRDPLLGAGGVLRVTAVACDQTEGLIVRAEYAAGPGPVGAGALELFWAYGGVNGQRGSRDGDIGTERVPISQWFQLLPEFCQDNTFERGADSFTLHAKAATIHGLAPEGSTLAVADAANWNNLPALLAPAADAARPLIVGRVPLASGSPLLLSLQRTDGTAADAEDLATYREVTAPGGKSGAAAARAPIAVLRREDLSRTFAAVEKHFADLRARVSVETPDPFLDAAVGALDVAADAVWDEPQQAIMHGAIAWRTKLLGWRGPYVLDALGWTERARANFTAWAGRQNTGPIPTAVPPASEKDNLARNEAGLHTNGDLSNSHYDMNLVFIDALFRHLRWTGDVEFAKQMWPVIERHLAWERRLFRREYGPDKLPLYEAYAVIWASDDLQYSGGGTAHASAYNYWHNRMAAELAPLVGADPAPYAHEADLIARALRTLLWTGDHFAESKDWLGLQLVHPDAALWTFYHVMDCDVPTPAEAASMADDIDARLPHLPVRGPGVPPGLHMLATSDWMPYDWSINNVVMAEAVHGALGLWQAGRAEEAWRVTKGSLLASMFMGISPGNVGSMNYLDVYRRESQRDFADGSGVLSRALVEGLFGVRPDLLQGRLLIAPGFPRDWDHATLHHPAVDLAYQRRGSVESFQIEARFKRPLGLALQLPVHGTAARVTADGRVVDGQIMGRILHVVLLASARTDIEITWSGAEPSEPPRRTPAAPEAAALHPDFSSGPVAKPEPVDLSTYFNDRVTQIFRNEYRSPRSPFVSLALPKQGLGGWAGGVNTSAEIDDTGLRAAAGGSGKFALPGGLLFTTPGPGEAKNVLFTSQWDNYPREATVPLTGRAHRLDLLMAGSTNPMQSRIDNGEVIATYTDGTTSRLALRNPENWWPIEQDYFTDDYQFRLAAPLPTRVDLKTGAVRVLDAAAFKGQGRRIPGGAATVLGLALDPAKELRSLTVRALANDVVIGLMAATLER